jgi:trehalose 6-phosphate synthase
VQERSFGSKRPQPKTNTPCHYDLIGFRTYRDAENFAHYLRDECGMPSRDPYTFQATGRTVRIGVFPVGVETAKLNP